MFASIQNRLLSFFLRRLLGHLLLRTSNGTSAPELNIESSILDGTLTLDDIRLDPAALVELVPLDLQPILQIAPIQYATVATLHLTIGTRALEVTLTRPHIHLKLLDPQHSSKGRFSITHGHN